MVTPNSTIRLHRFIPQTKAEGPGNRSCIWVQGCPIRCEGCAVPWTWPENGGYEVNVNELAGSIINEHSIEGITILGGEPFAQAGSLAKLGRIIKEAGLSVVTFTGYLLEEIEASPSQEWHDLVSVSDILIDGPFDHKLADTSRPWVGSLNKRYHFLTPRYRDLQAEIMATPNRLEIRISPNGTVLVNGMAKSEVLSELFDISFVRVDA